MNGLSEQTVYVVFDGQRQLQLLVKLRVKEVYLFCIFLTTTINHRNFNTVYATMNIKAEFLFRSWSLIYVKKSLQYQLDWIYTTGLKPVQQIQPYARGYTEGKGTDKAHSCV
jgi:hypothetical protein